MRSLQLVWFAPLLIGLGCGGTVDFGPGGNGGSTSSTSNGGSAGMGASGGSGGAAAAGGSTTTGMAGMGGAGGSMGGAGGNMGGAGGNMGGAGGGMGGAGGGTACDQACGKAEMCGLPAGQCGQFFNCSSMQGQCIAACINDPNITCQDLQNAVLSQTGPAWQCFQTCQGGMGGAGGTGGAGGMGGAGGAGGAGGNNGSPMECQQCGQQQCGAELQQCFGGGFQQCQAWLNCAQGCQDKACIDMCSMMHPAGAPLGACVCTKCAAGGCGYTCD